MSSLRRQSIVRVIDAQSDYCNQVGTVTSISTAKSTYQITFVDGNVATFKQGQIEVDSMIAPSAILSIVAARQAFVEKRDADRREMEARTRQMKLDRYLEARRAPATQYVRDPRSEAHRIEFGEQRDQFVRTYITIYAQPATTYTHAPSVGINWSAFGTVSPEDAIAFAQQLLAAAGEAIAVRAKLEADAGIAI